jgi:cytochrome P450
MSEGEREVEERRVRRMEGTMLQFGMGARTCIGKNISLLEIYKLVPSFLRRFEVCTLPSSLCPTSRLFFLPKIDRGLFAFEEIGDVEK